MADIFYRDENGNPLCVGCAGDCNPAELEMELVDESEAIECDGCGEDVSVK